MKWENVRNPAGLWQAKTRSQPWAYERTFQYTHRYLKCRHFWQQRQQIQRSSFVLVLWRSTLIHTNRAQIHTSTYTSLHIQPYTLVCIFILKFSKIICCHYYVIQFLLGLLVITVILCNLTLALDQFYVSNFEDYRWNWTWKLNCNWFLNK